MSDGRAAADGAARCGGLVVFLTGTGTEAGKTWTAAGLARAVRDHGRTVAACKPVQSYDPHGEGPTDAAVLAGATGQQPDDVCPPERTFAMPLAPPMAARSLGRACPDTGELAMALHTSAPADVLLVEGVGGLYSPIASDGHNLDLIERLEPDLVVVVASAALGAIHDILACTLPLASHRHTVFLNRFDADAAVHTLNLMWLRDAGIEVATSRQHLSDIVEAAADRIAG